MTEFLPQVLKKVMQHEIAESFFNDPVNPEALGIPEYREIVQVITPYKAVRTCMLGLGLLDSLARAREAKARVDISAARPWTAVLKKFPD